VRVSLAANTITGQAEILEENHYYPYGLRHAGYGLNTTDQNAAYKYRYNSREWQDELVFSPFGGVRGGFYINGFWVI